MNDRVPFADGKLIRPYASNESQKYAGMRAVFALEPENQDGCTEFSRLGGLSFASLACSPAWQRASNPASVQSLQ